MHESLTGSFAYRFAKASRVFNGREATPLVEVPDDPRRILAAKHAEPVYALFGKKGLGVAEWPAVNRPVLGDGLAYH